MSSVGAKLDIEFKTAPYTDWKRHHREQNDDNDADVLVQEELGYIPDVEAEKSKHLCDSMNDEQKFFARLCNKHGYKF